MILGIIKDLAEGRRFGNGVCVALSFSAFGLAFANNQELDGIALDEGIEQVRNQERGKKIDKLIELQEITADQIQELTAATKVILDKQEQHSTEIMRLRDAQIEP